MITNELQSPVIEAKLEMADIKVRHNKLYEKVQSSREALQRDTSERGQLIAEIDNLIADMRDISLQMKKSENYTDYDWLERAAMEWQEIFSQVFVVPKNIREKIELPPRPSKVLSSRARAEVPYSHIQSNIARLAYYIGENRKLAELLQKIQELERNRSRIHREIPSTSEEEGQDWRAATVYFAAGALAGRPNLAYQLGADSYRQIEQVFLDEVKRLNAYHIWQARGDGWELSEMEGDYRRACDELRQMLLNPNIKAPAVDFKDLRKYLTKNYHIDSKHFPNSKGAEELTRRKAQRIWERKLRPAQSPEQMKEDWDLAREYVALFYTNMIPVIEGRPKNMEKVLKAFGKPWREYGIINCLEAAIAIYFFDPDLVRECCDDENDII